MTYFQFERSGKADSHWSPKTIYTASYLSSMSWCATHPSLLYMRTHDSDKSRLAVNAVTLGDFEAPLRISVFAKEVFTGFSMVRELLHTHDVLMHISPS